MAYARVKTWGAGEVLTHTDLNAEFDAVQADINAKTGADLTNATVTTAKLASPNAAYAFTIPLTTAADALTAGALPTAVPGLLRNLAAFGFHFNVPVISTITGFSVSCNGNTAAGAGGPNRAQLFVNTTAVGAAVNFAAGDAVRSADLSQAVATTDTLEIRCTTANGANDGVTAAFCTIFCEAVHQA